MGERMLHGEAKNWTAVEAFDLEWEGRGRAGMRRTPVWRLTPEAFAPFGEVLQGPMADEGEDIGTGRFWDGALSIEQDDPRAGIIVYHPRALRIDRVERHPKSGQAFVNLAARRALLVLARDAGDRPDPGRIALYWIDPGAGFRLYPGTWHASPFPPPGASVRFLVLMRPGTIGPGTEWYPLPDALRLTPVADPT